LVGDLRRGGRRVTTEQTLWGFRLHVDPNLPPGSGVWFIGYVQLPLRPVERARARRVQRALRLRRQRAERRRKRQGISIREAFERLGWTFIGATEQPWELPGR
jgi:hypothetical protein